MRSGRILPIALAGGACLLLAAILLLQKHRGHVRPAIVSPENNLPALLKSKALREFALTETDKTRSSTLYTLTAKDRVVKIELLRGVEKETAETLLNDGIMGLEALYANALSPYPGDISNKVVADTKFRPRFFRKTIGQTTHSYYLLFANDRLGYGATTADTVRFKSLMGWLYCEASKDFFKIRYFAPLQTNEQELESLFLSLACQ